jgi:hypothetical protein
MAMATGMKVTGAVAFFWHRVLGREMNKQNWDALQELLAATDLESQCQAIERMETEITDEEYQVLYQSLKWRPLFYHLSASLRFRELFPHCDPKVWDNPAWAERMVRTLLRYVEGAGTKGLPRRGRPPGRSRAR